MGTTVGSALGVTLGVAVGVIVGCGVGKIVGVSVGGNVYSIEADPAPALLPVVDEVMPLAE